MNISKDIPGPADPARNHSFKDAAPLFSSKTSARQVERWVDMGLLPFVQLPRERVIRGRDINQFIASRVTTK